LRASGEAILKIVEYFDEVGRCCYECYEGRSDHGVLSDNFFCRSKLTFRIKVNLLAAVTHGPWTSSLNRAGANRLCECVGLFVKLESRSRRRARIRRK
jgi:hypothetical protein